jgi:hypothetical protein
MGGESFLFGGNDLLHHFLVRVVDYTWQLNIFFNGPSLSPVTYYSSEQSYMSYFIYIKHNAREKLHKLRQLWRYIGVHRLFVGGMPFHH